MKEYRLRMNLLTGNGTAKEMTKREKVIIGVMLTAVIFGAYSFLSSPFRK